MRDALTPLEPQSRFGDKPLKFQVVCPQNGTAVLKGLNDRGDTFPLECFLHGVVPQPKTVGMPNFVSKKYLFVYLGHVIIHQDSI